MKVKATSLTMASFLNNIGGTAVLAKDAPDAWVAQSTWTRDTVGVEYNYSDKKQISAISTAGMDMSNINIPAYGKLYNRAQMEYGPDYSQIDYIYSIYDSSVRIKKRKNQSKHPFIRF